ncbi:hypothetical protein [Abyssalbus ytuae]|uniref:DUF3052 family protein n=1 Tax=Abyssalbus ytuae TaxID=2926907 RepID=A0A9E6ZMG8_9FLAO|nr:hypothetical protein [Abyssalbus ytuae]UOB16935.1 hypothetical protein MQE35_14495 [Abyssalbus ytuae]
MKTVFEKLKLKDLKEIVILNEPEGFDKDLNSLQNIEIYESLVQVTKIEFALAFFTTIHEFEDQMQTLIPKLKDDALLWIAYPIDSSRTDLNDSYNWKPLSNKCFETTKSVIINDSWKAIRFRKLEYVHIKK